MAGGILARVVPRSGIHVARNKPRTYFGKIAEAREDIANPDLRRLPTLSARPYLRYLRPFPPFRLTSATLVELARRITPSRISEPSGSGGRPTPGIAEHAQQTNAEKHQTGWLGDDIEGAVTDIDRTSHVSKAARSWINDHLATAAVSARPPHSNIRKISVVTSARSPAAPDRGQEARESYPFAVQQDAATGAAPTTTGIETAGDSAPTVGQDRALDRDVADSTELDRAATAATRRVGTNSAATAALELAKEVRVGTPAGIPRQRPRQVQKQAWQRYQSHRSPHHPLHQRGHN